MVVIGTVVGCTPTDQTETSNREMTHDQRMDEKLYPFESHFLAMSYPAQTFGLQSYKRAMADVRNLKEQSTTRSGSWQQQGPGNIGGRINTIAINPGNPSEILLGYALGGIFKTDNGGDSWYPIFDDQEVLSLSDLTYDPNDPTIIYAATGDHNISGYPVTGDGVFKSTDGGTSWQRSGLTQAGVISEIHVATTDSDILYAASMGLPFERTDDRGLYKSVDAGASWSQVLFVNDSTGVIDIEVDPTDPDIVYAATWTRIRNNRESTIESEQSGIFKTEDGGVSWTRLQNGLPTGSMSRVGLDMYDADPDIVYAIYVHNNLDTLCSSGYQMEGIYRTDDAGDTWAQVPTVDNGMPCTVLGGFGWYFGQIRVSPTDPDRIFVLGVDMYESTDAGTSWVRAVPSWATYAVHADKHDLVFSGDDLILGTDGGAYRLTSESDEWQDIENIVSTQFYRVATNSFDLNSYGGAQDNGTTGGTDEDINNWPRISGGDGFQMVFHPTDPDVWYVESQRGNIRGTDNGGSSYRSVTNGLTGTRNWDMQYIMSSFDPDVLYTGTDRMFRGDPDAVPIWSSISGDLTDTADLSTARTHTMSTLSESLLNPDLLFCGMSDGYVWRTLDGGISWERINGELPRRYISDIKASETDESTVYLTIQGYIDNDYSPYIYRSEDYGDTWQSINGNLPQVAINDILLRSVDGETEEIFVGTDGGAYYSSDSGANWERLGDNMPIVPVYDLALSMNGDLVAGTFARGIYSFDLAQLMDTSTDDSGESANTMTVYPTVTEGWVTVEHNTTSGTFEIVGADGMIVRHCTIGSSPQRVDLTTLPTGSYYIRFPLCKALPVIKI